MTTILVIAAMIVVGLVGAMFYEMRKQLNEIKKPQDDKNQEVLLAWLKDMRESQQKSSETLRQEMDRTNRTISERLDNAAKVVQSVGTEVGKMQEIGQSMKELQQVLKSPKLRGNLGEQIMKDLLEQMLPKAGYQMQYKFRSGDTVDAVVKTKNGLIPIDSKFPMENFLAAQKAEDAGKPAFKKQFEKDVKTHIDKIAKKYIVPDEKTVDFAIMYVPGESVYYEILTATDLAEHGSNKKVYLVSPNTFHYFLKTVMVALEGEKIEERAKQVMVALRSIQNDTVKLGGDLGVLNRHVTNAKGAMDNVNTAYQRLGTKVEQTGALQEQQVEQVQAVEAELTDTPAPTPDGLSSEQITSLFSVEEEAKKK